MYSNINEQWFWYQYLKCRTEIWVSHTSRPHLLQVMVCWTSNSMLSTTGQVKAWEVPTSLRPPNVVVDNTESWPLFAPGEDTIGSFVKLLTFAISSFNWSKHWQRNSCASCRRNSNAWKNLNTESSRSHFQERICSECFGGENNVRVRSLKGGSRRCYVQFC